MHELSISNALLDQVAALVRQHGASGVSAITLRLGPLCGVEPALLQAAYLQSRGSTPARGAQLHIVPAALQVACHACGAATEAAPAHLACAACGSTRTRLLSGDDMLLESIDLLFET